MGGGDAIVHALLDAGADKDLAANNSFTPLHIAAKEGHDAVVRALLDAGADKNIAANHGVTPLCIAAAKGHDAIVRALLDADTDKDRARNDGVTPLCVAAAKGHDAIVRALLDAGADKNIAANDGTTPMLAAFLGLRFEERDDDATPGLSCMPTPRQHSDPVYENPGMRGEAGHRQRTGRAGSWNWVRKIDLRMP